MTKLFTEYLNESRRAPVQLGNFQEAEHKLKNLKGIVIDAVGDVNDVEKQIVGFQYDEAYLIHTDTDGPVENWKSDVFLVGAEPDGEHATIKEYFAGKSESVTTFKEFFESRNSAETFKLFVDYQSDANSGIPYLTEQENLQVDELVKMFEQDYGNDLTKLEEAFGTIVGGVTGFLIGPTIGKIIANALGVEKGVLYDMFTSKLVSTALGASIAKHIAERKK